MVNRWDILKTKRNVPTVRPCGLWPAVIKLPSRFGVKKIPEKDLVPETEFGPKNMVGEKQADNTAFLA